MFKIILNPKNDYWISIFFGTLLTFIFPSSGKGLHTLKFWNDQAMYVRGLNEVLNGENTYGPLGYVGPAYIGLTRFIKQGLDITIGSSFIILNKISFAIFFICLTYSILWAARKVLLLELNKTKIIFASFLIFGTNVFVLRTSQISKYIDVPWTNFLTMACWILTLLIWFISVKNNFKIDYFIMGLIAVIAFQTRGIDGTLLLLLNIILIILIDSESIKRINRFIFYLTGIVVGYFLIGILSKTFVIFSQYNDIETYFPNYRKPDFQGIWTRFVQVFIDPCYYSFCSENNFQYLSEPGVESWKLPMLYQLPALIPLVIIVLFIITILSFKVRLNNLDKNSRAIIQIAIVFYILSMIKMSGYFTLIVINGSIIKYGLSREFMTTVFVLLLIFNFTLPILLAYQRNFLVVLSTTISVSLALLIYRLSVVGPIPQIEGKHLSSIQVQFTPECKNGWSENCKVIVNAKMVNNLSYYIRNEGHIKLWNNEGFWKWFALDSNGVVPKAAHSSFDNCPNCFVDVLPIVVGVNGTPTYDVFIDMFRISNANRYFD
jgi:hypothetical protein